MHHVEMFAFTKYRDIETRVRVIQGHSEWRHSIHRIYDFLLVFSSNCGSVLHRFSDSWFRKILRPGNPNCCTSSESSWKFTIIFYNLVFTPHYIDHLPNLWTTSGVLKLKSLDYRLVKTSWSYGLLLLKLSQNVTDRHTDGQTDRQADTYYRSYIRISWIVKLAAWIVFQPFKPGLLTGIYL